MINYIDILSCFGLDGDSFVEQDVELESNRNYFNSIEDKVNEKLFKSKYMNYEERYKTLVKRCLKLDPLFLESYSVLQDIIRSKDFQSLNEALKFIINRLIEPEINCFL